MEKTELNLENPIFTFYIKTDNLPHQQVNELVKNYQRAFASYTNITTWIVPCDFTRVECVYDGKSKIRNTEISRIVKEINKRVDILSNSSSFEDFKMSVREWRLSEIIE